MKINNKADFYLYNDIRRILLCGYKDKNPRPHYADGTPAYTYSVNHNIRKYDLNAGEFPITSLRPQAWKSGIKEIFTIYQKPTNNISEMEKQGVTWWKDWDIGDGTIGQRYGATVKRYELMDNLLKGLNEDPYGRRHIMSLWQEADLNETKGLAPCAFLTIWNVREEYRKEYLDMVLIQRSGDMLTASGAGGINEIQYACLLMMVARHCGYAPGLFTHFVANEQIYDRHIEQAHILLDRYKPMTIIGTTNFNEQSFNEISEGYTSENAPKMILNPQKHNFYDFTIDDFELQNYEPIKPQLKLELGI